MHFYFTGKGVETFKDEPKKPKYIIKDKSQRQDKYPFHTCFFRIYMQLVDCWKTGHFNLHILVMRWPTKPQNLQKLETHGFQQTNMEVLSWIWVNPLLLSNISCWFENYKMVIMSHNYRNEPNLTWQDVCAIRLPHNQHQTNFCQISS